MADTIFSVFFLTKGFTFDMKSTDWSVLNYPVGFLLLIFNQPLCTTKRKIQNLEMGAGK
jgi:hypothetical protein